MTLNKEIVRELLDYDQETGKLFWKKRDIKWFSDGKKNSAESYMKTWNARNAGKEALAAKSSGYKHGTIFSKYYRSHQIIWLWMTGEFPEYEIDHINGIRNDNRWVNLRDVNRSTNIRNTKLRNDNTTGYPGISFDTKNKSLVASIYTDEGYKYLGRFRPEEIDKAIAVRKEAEQKYEYHKNHGRK